VKAIYSIVALLGAIALAALFAAPLVRAEPSSDNRPSPGATAQAGAAEGALASDAPELAPITVDLGITTAPSDPQAIAMLVERHNALRALLALEVAPAHPAEIEALVRREALRQLLALEAAPSHPAQIDALLQGYQAME
jgi:hypothetical protein